MSLVLSRHSPLPRYIHICHDKRYNPRWDTPRHWAPHIEMHVSYPGLCCYGSTRHLDLILSIGFEIWSFLLHCSTFYTFTGPFWWRRPEVWKFLVLEVRIYIHYTYYIGNKNNSINNEFLTIQKYLSFYVFMVSACIYWKMTSWLVWIYLHCYFNFYNLVKWLIFPFCFGSFYEYSCHAMNIVVILTVHTYYNSSFKVSR